MSTNPYATPKAAVADEPVPQGEYVPGGKSVPASRGWTWIVDAWALYKAAPFLWILILFVFGILLLACAMVPLLGGIAISLLMPLLVAGILSGCRAIDEGRPLEFNHLFDGFREKAGKLVLVGALSIAASIVITIVVGIGVVVVVVASGGNTDAQTTMAPIMILLLVLVVLALSVPLAAAMWFAPALVFLQDVDPIEAIKASFIGCLRNIVPFLVYGVAGLFLAILATIPIGFGWFVLVPVMAVSVYTAYRDIYLR
jgi:hypothetical protein